MTIADCAGRAVAVLVEAGFPPAGARGEVAVLARHLLGYDSTMWIVGQRAPAPPSFGADLAALAVRRSRGEPVAYLVGHREFYGRRFAVSPAVLIPRPETELLVERALMILRQHGTAGRQTVVDVGTGSGCIAVTLAAEAGGLRLTATDTSAAALAMAAANAAAHDVADRVTFVQQPLTAAATNVDLVVSNPPYIAWADRDRLMRDVRDFEPAEALFGGQSGLDIVAALVPDAFRALRPGGALLIEVGAGQAETVMAMAAREGFTSVAVHPDLAGIARLVEGVRPADSL